MIYLDTNVVVWLAAQALDQISQNALDIIDDSDNLTISPMVLLELKYLGEVKKITKNPESIVLHLETSIGLKVCEKPFQQIINKAKDLAWTRDPFDRIITAHASIDDNILLTSDEKIQAHYKHTIW